MADQEDRERESRESPVTKFEEIRLDEETEREDAAERLQHDELPDENET
jgi:hypothetical protein